MPLVRSFQISPGFFRRVLRVVFRPDRQVLFVHRAFALASPAYRARRFLDLHQQQQLNFVQPIYTLLNIDVRAVPDNVLALSRRETDETFFSDSPKRFSYAF
jgi:hypothetical protein